MNRNSRYVLLFLIGIITGQLLAPPDYLWLIMPVTTGLTGAIMIALFIAGYFRSRRSNAYDSLSEELFQEIREDIEAVRCLSPYIDTPELRGQLELICTDTIVLLNKVSEKLPENRISTGKFIRGNLDFIVHDILPQYIEMQDTPRYYELPEETMVAGQRAIATYARFLRRQIVKLELPDDLRYRVAVEMLNTLDAYVETLPEIRAKSA